MAANISLNLMFCLSSGIVSFLLFPSARKFALKFGAVDLPNERKVHTAPTPRVGGICFFVSFFLALTLMDISASAKLYFLLGGGVIFLIGLLDDIFSLSPWQKLSGQTLAVFIPVFSGLNFYSGKSPALRALFGGITVFWILLLTNAVNLSDGLDCLAAGQGLSFAFSLALFSLIAGGKITELFFVSMLLFFSLLGFVPHNKSPAKIFMGDCGSLFLGYTFAVLSVLWVQNSTNVFHLISLPIIFILPLSDTVQSFTRRILKGKNPFSADRGHFHHRLLSLGFSKSNAVLLLCTLSLIACFVAEMLICFAY